MKLQITSINIYLKKLGKNLKETILAKIKTF